eukprot:TRINITY_DN30057_c0_g1_i1.p1 TRINITY_DN30057_c0_g1~~TRINITY_DN30057_c0_g1_i1.p1  ORF type:complete len:192 (+),score=21.11 TRINITY_DN30057_c0_g1_i1:75-650(+)
MGRESSPRMLAVAVVGTICCYLQSAGLISFVTGIIQRPRSCSQSTVACRAALERVVKGSRVSVTHKTMIVDPPVEADSSEGKPPLVFVVGEKAVLPQLDEGVLGMTVGETKVFGFGPDNPLFGPHKEELTMEYPLDRMPADVRVGKMLIIKEGVPPVTVTSIGESTAIIDANHPYAGKAATLTISVVSCEE